MAKIILYNPTLPDAYTNYINEHGIKSRFDKDVIAFLETAEEINIYETTKEFFSENKNKLFVTKHNNSCSYYGWYEGFEIVGMITVAEYDETHRHIIEEYDGCESLVDIDAYECVDKEHNIWAMPM